MWDIYDHFNKCWLRASPGFETEGEALYWACEYFGFDSYDILFFNSYMEVKRIPDIS